MATKNVNGKKVTLLAEEEVSVRVMSTDDEHPFHLRLDHQGNVAWLYPTLRGMIAVTAQEFDELEALYQAFDSAKEEV